MLNILESIEDKKIIKILELLKDKKINYKTTKMKKVSNKFRYVDPQFMINNELLRLSDADHKYKIKIASAMNQNEKGILCPVI